jgi:hypothetical protein
MDENRKKSAVWKAVRNFCLNCAGDRAAVARCDGQFIGHACSLHAYRNSSVRKTDPDGHLLGHFFKGPMLKAIRAQCVFCCNGYDPRIACGDPSCSLYPYQRGTSSFLHVGKSSGKEVRSAGETALHREDRGILPPPHHASFIAEECAL